jgi:hypothetical protein
MDSALGVCGAEMRAWVAAQGDADEDRSWVVRGAYRFRGGFSAHASSS